MWLKRLDTFILSKFLLMFAGAFFVCQFVFMMQFTWRYIDDLVGKGLTLDILSQFFWYMGLTLVPQTLPLAVLLSSLITFGNMGESLELLSMKAAGIPLLRIMRSLVVTVILLAGLSFGFQNTSGPDAQKGLRQLLISMRQSQPAVEIPEGIFYNGVPKVNMYVEHKVAETGMLYQVIIYKTDQGFDKAQIVLADSGRMEMTADKLHLRLTMWSGEQFQSLQSEGSMRGATGSANMPYDRETFRYKEFLIDFDSNFNLMDGDLLSNMPSSKTMTEIVQDADSMSGALDSIALAYVADIKAQRTLQDAPLTHADTLRLAKDIKRHPIQIDTLFAHTDAATMQRALNNANSSVQRLTYDLSWKTEVNDDQEKFIRRHWIEWHTKITLSLACILFFFVGAPLGAIIRKGGLGTPTVISVIIFIFYYIINTSGMKMAREGSINMFVGMWISSFILAPAGTYLTYMSNKDSQVFNIDAYKAFFRKMFGVRLKRHIAMKEVIITPPDYAADLEAIMDLQGECERFKAPRLMLYSYWKFRKDQQYDAFAQRLEQLVEDLANTRDIKVLHALNSLPVLSKRHVRTDLKKTARALKSLEKHVTRLTISLHQE